MIHRGEAFSPFKTERASEPQPQVIFPRFTIEHDGSSYCAEVYNPLAPWKEPGLARLYIYRDTALIAMCDYHHDDRGIEDVDNVTEEPIDDEVWEALERAIRAKLPPFER